MIHLSGYNYNSREVIQNIFSPLVGVITSPLADDVCQRNNLSFVELLQPFSKLPTDVQFRDVSGTSIAIRGLRLNFCDVDWRPPQPVLARKILNESVTNANNEKTKFIHYNDINLEVPTSEPWFEKWRETFLNVQFPSDHEFMRHFLSCLIVVSSNELNVIETAQKLTQRIQQMQNSNNTTTQKLPKWLQSNNVLNCYVMLHEGNRGDLSGVQQSYEMLKSAFKNSECFLIQINSVPAFNFGTTTAPSTNVVEKNACVPDYWKFYIKRQPKMDSQGSDSLQSMSKSQQADAISVISLHPSQNSSISDFSDTSNNERIGEDITTASSLILHPLSPVQENAQPIHSKSMSISNENLLTTSQTALASLTTTAATTKISGSTSTATTTKTTATNSNIWVGFENENDSILYGGCLNTVDVESIRHFVQDYAIRALIPYVEGLVAILSEAIVNKKGVSKSLLSATKRWFATSKPAAGASTQNAVIYTNESAELQTRKLGDLYFMFGNYNLAFQAYHQAKRDFNADSAWQYYAGALEMAAISAFMLGTANRKTFDYMEDAIVCYLTVCKLQQFAIRATLLSIECLKTARLHSEAAKQLIRLASEESEIRSALFLEHASYCYLACMPPMFRKYAFHIVLSGNRYARVGQRKHAYRCNRQALQVFQNRGWVEAEDHIQHTLAKQAYTLKKLKEARQSFAHLLRSNSLQSKQQVSILIKEYILTQNELQLQNADTTTQLVEHAIPEIEEKSIRILTSYQPMITDPSFVVASNIDLNSQLSDNEQSLWRRLEEMIVTLAADNKPFVFKPTQYLFTEKNPAIDYPIAVQNEPIDLRVTLINPVKCNIILMDVNLLWQLKLDNNEILTNQCFYSSNSDRSNDAAISAAIKSTKIDEIILEDFQKNVHFQLTPKLTGSLKILGIVAKIAAAADPTTFLQGILSFDTTTATTTATETTTEAISTTATTNNQTKQLSAITAVAQPTHFNNNEKNLSLKIIPQVPVLSVSFTSVPQHLIAGEIHQVTVMLRNMGITPIDEIYLACDNPRWLTVMDKNTKMPLSILSTITNLANSKKLVKEQEIRRQHVIRLLKPSLNKDGNDFNSGLKAQESTTITMWIQAPYTKGEFNLRLLFYYGVTSNTLNQNSNGNDSGISCSTTDSFNNDQSLSTIKYRLVRHCWKFNVDDGLNSKITCVVSNRLTNELGLNINIANESTTKQNQIAEISINRLGLYCDRYQLNPTKIYPLNQMEIPAAKLGEFILKPSKTANFECRLTLKSIKNDANSSQDSSLKTEQETIGVENINNDAAIINTNLPTLVDLIKKKISFIDFIRSFDDDASATVAGGAVKAKSHQLPSHPNIEDPFSFLIKNETLHFDSNLSTEEFHKIILTQIKHMTIIVEWRATILFNTQQSQKRRTAIGQHFVQLQNLYETISCPLKTTNKLLPLHTSTFSSASQNLSKTSSVVSNETTNTSVDIDDINDNDNDDYDDVESGNDDVKGNNNVRNDENTEKYGGAIKRLSNKYIYNFNKSAIDLDQQQQQHEQYQKHQQQPDYWSTNETFIGRRCLLEDKNYATTVGLKV